MILCQKVVPTIFNANGRMVGNTYCMKPSGHKGECDKVKTKTLPEKENNGKILTPQRPVDPVFGGA